MNKEKKKLLVNEQLEAIKTICYDIIDKENSPEIKNLSPAELIEEALKRIMKGLKGAARSGK